MVARSEAQGHHGLAVQICSTMFHVRTLHTLKFQRIPEEFSGPNTVFGWWCSDKSRNFVKIKNKHFFPLACWQESQTNICYIATETILGMSLNLPSEFTNSHILITECQPCCYTIDLWKIQTLTRSARLRKLRKNQGQEAKIDNGQPCNSSPNTPRYLQVTWEWREPFEWQNTIGLSKNNMNEY